MLSICPLTLEQDHTPLTVSRYVVIEFITAFEVEENGNVLPNATCKVTRLKNEDPLWSTGQDARLPIGGLAIRIQGSVNAFELTI